MTAFPDCRNDRTYNEKYLDLMDSTFINGFDHALDEVVNLFENNLETYESELNCVGEDTEDEVFSRRNDLCQILSENSRIICTCISQWIEMERNMIITSMIDGMDDEDYRLARQRAGESDDDREQ